MFEGLNASKELSPITHADQTTPPNCGNNALPERLASLGAAAQSETTRSRQAVVVVHLHCGGIQYLANSEIAGRSVLKSTSGRAIWPPKRLVRQMYFSLPG
jgi:hypothetical protein